MKPRLILGSASLTRRKILAEMGYAFDVKTAGIDEQAIRRERPEDLVLALAHAKADAICTRDDLDPTANTLLITADQVVVHEGRILEKPTSAEEARRFIAGYARSPARTVGSVVVTNLGNGLRAEGIDTAEIYFHPIPDDVIERLISEGSVYSAAGGLMIEHPLVSPFVEAMVGEIDNVMGLSKHLLTRLLEKAMGKQSG
eukprot:jgi/Chlat1/2209/Chrsp17S00164